MARRIKGSGPSGRLKTGPRGLPTREEVITFLSEHPGRAGKREIARAFAVKPADKVALKAMLRDMAEDGLITKRGTRLQTAGELPSVAVLLVTGRDDDGELIAELEEWDPDTQGALPRIYVKAPRRGGPGAMPGVSDRFLGRLARDETGEGCYLARPIKVFERARKRTLGLVRIGERGEIRIDPIDKKARAAFRVDGDPKDAFRGGVSEGDLVAVETLKARKLGMPRAQIVERLASITSEKAISLIAIHNHDIPHVFAPAVMEDAQKAQLPAMGTRLDLTHMDFVTIDPPDAKDHDDAVYAEPDADERNPDGWVVWVAIADVAEFVRPKSAMDKAALERGNSVYFPDRVVPMLPERISNDLCSLREGEDRPAMVARMVFDANGRKRGQRFIRAMIRSRAKLSYAAAQAAVDADANGTPLPDTSAGGLHDSVLAPLWKAYGALARGRQNREPLELDLPERRLVLDENGAVEGIVIPPRLDAHRLIEEFMIQANVAAAEMLEKQQTPLLYRVHDSPALSKLEALREFLQTLDLSLPKTGNLRPSHFNGLLSRVAESTNETLVNEVVLRSQSQAEYSPENYGHFGLNLRRYAHFTSPIRRYADLIVHRALIAALELGEGGLDAAGIATLGEVAALISTHERRAMAAERETTDRLIAGYLSEQTGSTFEGRITGVTRAGLFVRLQESGADGFVPMKTLDYDWFGYEEAAHALVGERTGEVFQLGDIVTVKLVEALPFAGALRFDMVSDGKSVKDAGIASLKGASGKRRGRRMAGKGAREGRGGGRPGQKPGRKGGAG